MYKFSELIVEIPFLSGSKLSDEISLGYSGDNKYVFTKGDKTYLLRTQKASLLDRSNSKMTIDDKLELITKVMQNSYLSGARVPNVADYGVIKKLDVAYLIVSYIVGESVFTSMSNVDNKKQYKVGRDLGDTIKKIHSSNSNVPTIKWAENFLKPVFENISKYNKCKENLSFKMNENMENTLVSFIEMNKHLLDDVRLSFIHNDIHDMNIIQNKGIFTGLIDFTEIIIGDVVYDHKYINHTTVWEYPYFVSGVMHSYFGVEINENIWRRLYLYIACNIMKFNPLPHLDYFTLEEATEELLNNEKMFNQLNCLESFPPKWYKGLDFADMDS